MSHSITRVHNELKKEAEIREIRAEWPHLKQQLAELQQKHNVLATYVQKGMGELQEASNRLYEKISRVDYRGPFGWWRRRRDLRSRAVLDLAARKLAAKMEAAQQRAADVKGYRPDAPGSPAVPPQSGSGTVGPGDQVPLKSEVAS